MAFVAGAKTADLSGSFAMTFEAANASDLLL